MTYWWPLAVMDEHMHSQKNEHACTVGLEQQE